MSRTPTPYCFVRPQISHRVTHGYATYNLTTNDTGATGPEPSEKPQQS